MGKTKGGTDVEMCDAALFQQGRVKFSATIKKLCVQENNVQIIHI
jgi:hypothetical protein